MSKLVPIIFLTILVIESFFGSDAAPTVVVVGRRRGGGGGRRGGGGGMNGYGSKYGEDGMDMAKSWNAIGQEYAKWPIGQAGGK